MKQLSLVVSISFFYRVDKQLLIYTCTNVEGKYVVINYIHFVVLDSYLHNHNYTLQVYQQFTAAFVLILSTVYVQCGK